MAECEVPELEFWGRVGTTLLPLQFIKVGRIAYPEIKSLVGVYEQRLTATGRVVCHELKDDAALDRLLKRQRDAGHHLIALDERGRQHTSVEFAARLKGLTEDPRIRSVTFLVGGPAGLSAAHRQLADDRLGLAKGTLTSDLAWLLLWEQVYRAQQIIQGTGYHHA